MTQSAMAVNGWAEVLDELEARLRRQTAVVEGHTTILPDDTPFTVEDELPDELRPRALALLAMSRGLEERAAVVIATKRQRRHSFPPGSPEGTPLGQL